MTQHAVKDAQAQDEACGRTSRTQPARTRPPTRSRSSPQLREQGVITEEQFEQGKAKILA